MGKHTIKELDEGQLEMMWNFLRFDKKQENTKEDVRAMKRNLDIIRQAIVQKTGGQRGDDPKEYVPLADVATYINFVVLDAMDLYLHGGLDKLEEVLEDD